MLGRSSIVYLSYKSVRELVDAAQKASKSISDLVLADQVRQMGISETELYNRMARSLQVMKEGAAAGLKNNKKSDSGLSGGDAYKFLQAVESGRTLSNGMLQNVIAYSLAVSEVNSSMGRIVAAPTAGSCGILPAVILSYCEEKGSSENKAVMSLFTAAGLGLVIAKQASISGAEGGCQAECGSASAMAAAALVELAGGTPVQAAHAAAMALKSVLGLVCDPVAGLVEVPCIKRNVMGAVNAFTSADLALAGIESVIPIDEVISAMKSVGNMMAGALKETAEGGLAATPTGRRLARSLTI